MIGVGLVTQNGISFWDEEYSTGAALKEGWFRQDVGFLVEVVSICPIHQQIVISYRGKKHYCNKLARTEGLPCSIAATYFDGIELLKQQRKDRKSDLNE